jgi:F-type H+-transporting ATPase subunit b
VLSFPDWTFFFQIALFLFLWSFLRRFLFDPNFSVLKEREDRGVGALQEASRVKTEAAAIEEQYKSRLAEARSGTTQEVETIYRDAEAQAQNLVASARTEAADVVSQTRETLGKEIDDVRLTLEERVPDFSRDIAQKLLGRSLT